MTGRGAAGRLDRERIVDAALALLDRDGLSGVTTRPLATLLGVKQPALYWHVRNRDELLDLLAERIVEDARWPAQAGGWRATVEAMTREYLRCLLAHRDGARVVAGRPPTGPSGLRAVEILLSCLTSGGMDAQRALDAGIVLNTFVVGFASELQAAQGRERVELAVDPHLFPITYKVREHLPTDSPADFEYGLSLILDGIEQQARSGRARRRTRTTSSQGPRPAAS